MLENKTSSLALFHHSFDAIMLCRVTPNSAHGATIEQINPSFESLFGYKQSELKNKRFDYLYGLNTTKNLTQEMSNAIRDEKHFHARVEGTHKNGDKKTVALRLVPLRDDGGMVTHFAFIQRDVSSRSNQIETLVYLSRHDRITDCYNRETMYQYINEAFYEYQRYHCEFSVLIVNIDKFRALNDKHGHLNGDVVLKEIGNFLKSRSRLTDIFGRHKGDEFILLLKHTPLEGAEIAGRRLLKALSLYPINLPNIGPIKLAASVGVATVNSNARTASTVIQNALSALRDAKTLGNTTRKYA